MICAFTTNWLKYVQNCSYLNFSGGFFVNAECS